MRSGSRPLSDGEQGLAVVATLEAAERSLRSGGVRVPVDTPALPPNLLSVIHPGEDGGQGAGWAEPAAAAGGI